MRTQNSADFTSHRIVAEFNSFVEFSIIAHKRRNEMPLKLRATTYRDKIHEAYTTGLIAVGKKAIHTNIKYVMSK